MARDWPEVATTVFGWLTVAFWASTTIPLLPLLSTETAKSLASEVYNPEMKELDPIYNLSRDRLETLVIWIFRKEFAKGLAIAVVGAISGVLMIARERSGRLLALVFCSVMFSLWSIHLVRFLIKTEFSRFLWLLGTAGGVQLNVINPLFFVLTVSFLTRRSIANCFKRRPTT